MKKVFLCLFLSLLLVVPSFSETTEFVDLLDSHWAFGAVETLKEMQIISGYEDGSFKPDALITREEFAVMISKGFNLKMYDNELATFSDVAPGKWSYVYVEKAKEFLTGYYPYGGAPYFQPELYTTREDVAVSLVRALNLPLSQMNIDDVFIDSSDISFQLKQYIATAVKAELIVGYTTGEFKPQSPITRAEVAVLINKALKQSNYQQDFSLFVDMPSEKISPYLVIRGQTHKDALVKINGAEISTLEGNFSALHVLSDGEKVYTFEVTSEMPDGRMKSYYGEVVYEIPDDYFVVNLGSISHDDTIVASGYIDTFESDFIITINNERIHIGNDGYWEKKLVLKQGENTFEFSMVDYLNRRHDISKTVTFIPEASVLTIHLVPEISLDRVYVLSGYIDAYHDNSVLTVNNGLVRISGNGLFSKEITLMPGKNKISVAYTNEYNMLSSKDYEVLYETQSSIIELNEPPMTSHENSFMLNFEVVGEKGNHVVTYLNNQLLSEMRTVRNGFKESLIYQELIHYKEGINEFTITSNLTDGRSSSRKFAVEFLPSEPKLELTSLGYEGDHKLIRFSVTDSYNSDITAYYGELETKAISIQKFSDNQYMHYFKIEYQEGVNEFTVINQYGKKSTHTFNE